MNKFVSRLELWTSAGRIGVLRKSIDVQVHETVNGEYFVTFAYPKIPDDPLYTSLVDDNDVAFPQDVERGQKFRIKRVEEVRKGRKVYKVVEAHHIAFTLNNYYLDDYIDFAAAKTLTEMLELLGADTPFTFAVEGSFSAQDIFEFGEKRKFDLLQDLRKLYGAEIALDNYTITLTTRKGGNYGAAIRYRSNMKGIKKTSHSMERITMLFGYGKNGLTIEGYDSHTVKYIVSSYFDPNNPYMDSMEWPEVETQARLFEEMKKYLQQNELPKVSYDVDFVELEKSDPAFEINRIREAGDTVTVSDDELGYSFEARVHGRNALPFAPRSGSVVLSNFREFKVEDYIYQAKVDSKKAIIYTSKNAVLKGQKYDDSVTLVDGLGMKVTDDQDRVMVRLGQIAPGEYGQAMYNKAGVKTIWQDAETGDARFTGKIESSSIVGGEIIGGTIIGTFITTALTGPHIELSNTGNFLSAMNTPSQKVTIYSASSTGAPAISFDDGSYAGSIGISSLGFDFASNRDVRLITTGEVNFTASGVRVPSWTQLINKLTGVDMQSALDSKANNFTGVTGGVTVGTTTMVFSNGILISHS